MEKRKNKILSSIVMMIGLILIITSLLLYLDQHHKIEMAKQEGLEMEKSFQEGKRRDPFIEEVTPEKEEEKTQ